MSDEPIKPNPQIEQAAASDESIQKVHSILLREKPEPKEGYTPMPLFILGFVTVMIFVCTLYFVHNRVHDIEQVQHKLKKIVPEAKIAVGHGQILPKLVVGPHGLSADDGV